LHFKTYTEQHIESWTETEHGKVKNWH